ncbi:ABC transporter substrate-binding protein [Marinobacter alexandrii]|uniref:ABC transporter substrate-binding protein n=1 Tax=Marinobacter alexandrii TaxID=2570351 RepID=UPI0031F0D028
MDNPEDVITHQPDIIISSWCRRKFRPEQVTNRADWADTPAVKNNPLFKIKSPLILQS